MSNGNYEQFPLSRTIKSGDTSFQLNALSRGGLVVYAKGAAGTISIVQRIDGERCVVEEVTITPPCEAVCLQAVLGMGVTAEICVEGADCVRLVAHDINASVLKLGAINANFEDVEALLAAILARLSGGCADPLNVDLCNDIESTETCRIVTVDGVGYSIGDTITHVKWFNGAATPPVLLAETYINETTNLVLPDDSVFADSELCPEATSNLVQNFCVSWTENAGVDVLHESVTQVKDDSGAVLRQFTIDSVTGLEVPFVTPVGGVGGVDVGSVIWLEDFCQLQQACIYQQINKSFVYTLNNNAAISTALTRLNLNTGLIENLAPPPYLPLSGTFDLLDDNSKGYGFENVVPPRLWEYDVPTDTWADTGIDLSGSFLGVTIGGIVIQKGTNDAFIVANARAKIGTLDLNTGVTADLGTYDFITTDISVDEFGTFYAIDTLSVFREIVLDGVSIPLLQLPDASGRSSFGTYLGDGLFSAKGRTVGPTPLPISSMYYIFSTTNLLKTIDSGVLDRGNGDQGSYTDPLSFDYLKLTGCYIKNGCEKRFIDYQDINGDPYIPPVDAVLLEELPTTLTPSVLEWYDGSLVSEITIPDGLTSIAIVNEGGGVPDYILVDPDQGRLTPTNPTVSYSDSNGLEGKTITTNGNNVSISYEKRVN